MLQHLQVLLLMAVHKAIDLKSTLAPCNDKSSLVLKF